MPSEAIALNPETIKELNQLGFEQAGKSYLPAEIFSLEQLGTVKGFLILLVSGILVGFGSRYAGGCTSGHTITGISSFQKPSMLATIGFFVGGLLMVWFLIPLIF